MLAPPLNAPSHSRSFLSLVSTATRLIGGEQTANEFAKNLLASHGLAERALLKIITLPSSMDIAFSSSDQVTPSSKTLFQLLGDGILSDSNDGASLDTLTTYLTHELPAVTKYDPTAIYVCHVCLASFVLIHRTYTVFDRVPVLLVVDEYNALLSARGRIRDPITSRVRVNVSPEDNPVAKLFNRINSSSLVCDGASESLRTLASHAPANMVGKHRPSDSLCLPRARSSRPLCPCKTDDSKRCATSSHLYLDQKPRCCYVSSAKGR